MAADIVSASTELDIFATKPVQTSNLETTDCIQTHGIPDQSDLEFLITADHHTYIDLNI